MFHLNLKKMIYFNVLKKFQTLNIANISELYIMLHEIGHAKQHETLKGIVIHIIIQL